MVEAALLDVDGTLIDSNLLHVLAWRRAFQRLGRQVPANAILQKVGMGGDKLAPAILGEGELADRAREIHGEEYADKGLIEKCELLPGAIDLLRALRARGVRIALASSAKEEEIERYLGLLGGRDMVDAITTKADVEATKPAPDIFAVALEKLGHPRGAIVVGDTIYDIQAAAKLGLPCVALLSGGIERATLEGAGAAAIYDSAADVVSDLDAVLRLG